MRHRSNIGHRGTVSCLWIRGCIQRWAEPQFSQAIIRPNVVSLPNWYYVERLDVFATWYHCVLHVHVLHVHVCNVNYWIKCVMLKLYRWLTNQNSTSTARTPSGSSSVVRIQNRATSWCETTARITHIFIRCLAFNKPSYTRQDNTMFWCASVWHCCNRTSTGQSCDE